MGLNQSNFFKKFENIMKRFSIIVLQKIGSKMMKMRHAYMSGLPNKKVEKDYLTNFFNKYICLNDFRKAVINGMKNAFFNDKIDKNTWNRPKVKKGEK